MGRSSGVEPETLELAVNEDEPALQDKGRVTKPVTPPDNRSVPRFDPAADSLDMPEIRESAVASATQSQSEKPAENSQFPGIFDRLGNAFDPAVHENDGGKPRLCDDGKTVRRKRGFGATKQDGSKTQQSSKIDPTGGKSASAGTAPPPAINAQMQATANMCAGVQIAMMMMIGGPDLKPEGPEEAIALSDGWRAVCERYGMTDLPPLMALSLISMTYVGKRWTKPTFAERRRKWWDSMKGWIFRKKMDEEKRKREVEQNKSMGGAPPPAAPVVDPEKVATVDG